VVIFGHGGDIGAFGRSFCWLDYCVSSIVEFDIVYANWWPNRFMGQDGVYLQVIATSGEGKEQKHAHKVLTLLKRGKHWVLVTLLLSNVIVNESLPIVLDRSLGGGWPAVVGSTALIGMDLRCFRMDNTNCE
jgi:hypothetical protein